MNSPTKTPDLSNFFKQLKKSHTSSRTGTKQMRNPTEAQRHLMDIKNNPNEPQKEKSK